MPVEWKVHPYDTLKQLREAYTFSLFQSSRKLAVERAREIQKWMIENAPWEDRTIEERIDAYRRRQTRRKEHASPSEQEAAINVPVPNEYLKGARLGLRAVAQDTSYTIEDMKQEKGYKAAVQSDLNALNKINRSRTNPKLTKKQMRLPALERAAIKKSLQKIPLKRLPSGITSAAKSYLQGRQQDLPLLVQIDISQDPRIAYTLWLEVAFGGRYSIISRTVDHWADKLYNDVKRLANLVQNQGQITMGPVETQQQAYEKVKATVDADHDYAMSTRDNKYDPVTVRRFKPFDEEGRKQRTGRKSYWESKGRERYQTDKTNRLAKRNASPLKTESQLRDEFQASLDAARKQREALGDYSASPSQPSKKSKRK